MTRARSNSPYPRALVYVALPFAVVMASAMVARAFDTTWIASGQTLSAQMLKTDLDEVQSRLAALERSSDCPAGYTKDPNATGFTLCTNAGDEIVKVGTGASAFWIDRYEASIWDGSTQRFGTNDDTLVGQTFAKNGQTQTAWVARSVRNVMPARYVTWFQADLACRNAGKRLPAADEWLAAARGTVDPGSNDGTANSKCNTMAATARATGQAGSVASPTVSCVSYAGAEDMIGNYSEFTGEWYGAPGTGSGAAPTATNWPSGYGGNATCATGGATCGDDSTTNLNTWTYQGVAGTQVANLPAVAYRGGTYGGGTGAGVFSLSLMHAPSDYAPYGGFRCVKN